jgi:hypothetical protein
VPSPQWTEKYQPRDDPDYQRLVVVTETIEEEIGRTGAEQVLSQRFDYDTALKYAMRRTEETSQKTKLENPDKETLIRLLSAGWAEGFVFGALAYTQEQRGREQRNLDMGPLLDRIALVNVDHTLSSASAKEMRKIFADVISDEALAYVSLMRSMRAEQVLREMNPVTSHQAVCMLVAGHWHDGFLTGLVFEELGGHRPPSV